jgi:hypothetical protein
MVDTLPRPRWKAVPERRHGTKGYKAVYVYGSGKEGDSGIWRDSQYALRRAMETLTDAIEIGSAADGYDTNRKKRADQAS